ncbi:MAG: 50S ribosomal protein L11 methyltransferase [Candidatus Omnitrophica bacterium]|nr:50S ribosomal protein L11 methyltransferase [Candidatus Omnitrophota bacterium]
MILYEQIPSLLLEYSISSSQEEALALPRLVLETMGFKTDDISETFQNKLWTLKVFTPEKTKIEILKKNFSRLSLPNIKTSSRILKPAQWLTLWKTQWKPLSLTKTIDVVPYWYKGKYKTSKQVIFLDTLMSFGTGMHETTQLIAQLIEDNRSHLSSFLDVGTGTGILTLAALKHGAQRVTAMDISPLSIQATRSNLKVNGLKAKIVLSDIGRLPVKEKYQMVAANLITDDLLKDRKRIVNLVKPDGLLMVSGISLDNLSRLKEGFKDQPLICRKVSRGKEWAAILYVKKT